MPFVSSQQRRLFYAKQRRGEMSQATIDRWNEETKAQQAAGELPKKLPKRVKSANFDPKTLFAQAMQGALAGAIAGSRRSLDDATLQGVAQGAAIGALGGVLGGQIQGGQGQAGALIGGAGAGYLASRGPRGDSRPDLHLRIDRGTGAPLPSPQEKQAADGRRVVGGGKYVIPPDEVIPGPRTWRVPPRPNKVPGIQDAQFHSPRNRRFALAAALLAAGAGAGIAAMNHRDNKRRTEKRASNLGHAAELAGLGILAAPTVAEMRGRHVSDKTKHRAELAGLGVLAAPSAIHLGGKAVNKIKGLAKGIAKRAEINKEALSRELLQRALMKSNDRAVAAAHGAHIIGLGGIKRRTQRLATEAMAGRHLARAAKIQRRLEDGGRLAKRAEDIKGDADKVDAERAALKATPLGERVLADVDGANENPRVAREFLRRLMARTIAEPRQLK